MRRTDPVAFPSLPAPPKPTATRNAVVTVARPDPGDFATLRNLTVTGSTLSIAVPPGTYGVFVANGGASILLGVPGAVTPAVYNLQGLRLNTGSHLEIVGPVIVTAAGTSVINGTAGDAANLDWLRLQLPKGALTVSATSTLNGHVVVPAGLVTVAGRINGRVTSDRITVPLTGSVHQD